MSYPRKLPEDPEILSRMRHVDGLSLQEIADKYGVSRERIRQVIGNTGKGFLIDFVKRKFIADPKLTTPEAIKKYKNRGKTFIQKQMAKIHHAIKGGQGEKGVRLEILVSKRLKDEGFENTLTPYAHPFDIQMKNGLRIEVKSASTTSKTSPDIKSNQYRFHVMKNTRGEYCDFFICVITTENAFFIIPNQEIAKVASVFITFPKPKGAWGKYHKYHDRWDLLK